MPSYSLYLHIPFCTHRCGYCDFNTYAGQESLVPDYIDALCREIEHMLHSAGERLPAHTIFFGGGTPSLLPTEGIERVLSALEQSFDLAPGMEVTLEANPGTLTRAYLRDLRSLGVNRLSLGVQSAHPAELRLLERIHDYPTAIQSYSWARQAGFENINLDLIFGLPEQLLETWQQTLRLTCGLQPDHLSLYALTMEHGTPFGYWEKRGLLSSPDPDIAAEMYEWADGYLQDQGFIQYEISNWARALPEEMAPDGRTPLRACRHNLQYWRNLPYIGLGAGAHGYAGGKRTANVLSPAAYIQRLRKPPQEPFSFPQTPAVQTSLAIDEATAIGETMMMGLRLVQEGVSEAGFEGHFHRSLREVFPKQIERLIQQGLLEWAPGTPSEVLRLTPRGRMLGNRVFMEFI
jgi:oxygen-independent coproporphyrinogen-3 oxidase